MPDRKKTCFVIGPIGSEGSDVRNQADMLLEYVITRALTPLGYEVLRADKVAKPGSITDDVIMRTIESDLVIADMTGNNANAFYELGIRHMEEKPVIHMIAEGDSLKMPSLLVPKCSSASKMAPCGRSFCSAPNILRLLSFLL